MAGGCAQLGLCLFAALIGAAGVQAGPESQEDTPIVFNSTLPLRVGTLSKITMASCEDHEPVYLITDWGRWGRGFGSTPSKDGVIIPRGRPWVVQPNSEHFRNNFGDEELKILAEEIRQFGASGLCLWDSGGKVTDEGIKQLTGIASLQFLRLPPGNTTITDCSMEAVASLVNLRYLSMTYLPNVSEEGLKYLGTLSQLEQLVLTAMPVTSHVMERLAALSKLEVLELRGCRQLGAGLKEIGKLKNLRYLELRNTGVGAIDEHVAELARLERLEYLDLNGNQLNDESLRHLGKLRRLRSLKLAGNPGITDAGLRHLESLEDLRYLDVRETQVTADGAERLWRVLPRVHGIHHSGGPSWRPVVRLAVALIGLWIVIRIGIRYRRRIIALIRGSHRPSG